MSIVSIISSQLEELTKHIPFGQPFKYVVKIPTCFPNSMQEAEDLIDAINIRHKLCIVSITETKVEPILTLYFNLKK